MELQSLHWAPAHDVILDDHGGGYFWCADVDDQDGIKGTWIRSRQPMPRDRSGHARPRCKPGLVLSEALPRTRRCGS